MTLWKKDAWTLTLVGLLGCAPDAVSGTTTRADSAVSLDSSLVQGMDSSAHADTAVDASAYVDVIADSEVDAIADGGIDALVDGGSADAANADGGTDRDAAASCFPGQIQDNASCPSGKEQCANDATTWECYSCGMPRVVTVDYATCNTERRRCTAQGLWECCDNC